MALIKSALEIALEKTKDLKIDEAAVEATELRQAGKRTAGQYLEDSASVDLVKQIEAYPKEKRNAFRQGVCEVLASQIQLPTNEGMVEKLETVAKGYGALVKGSGLIGGAVSAVAEKKVLSLFQQLGGFFRQYLDDMKNVDQVIRKQWAPKLREKEREMSLRLGQEVRLDPMMDPEFAAFYKQNVGQVRQQYQAALEKAKADLATLVGIDQE